MVWNDHFNKTARFQLAAARLCLDCEVVYEGDSCPACDSRIFYKLTDAIPAMLHPSARIDEAIVLVPQTTKLSYIPKNGDGPARGTEAAATKVLAKVS